MRTQVGVAGVLAALLTLAPVAAGADPPPARTDVARAVGVDPTLVPGQLLVTTADAAATAAVRGPGAVPLGARVTQVAVPRGTEDTAAAALREQAGVLAVERSRYRRSLARPSDPLYPRQWAHPVASAELAWEVTTGSTDVRVAIIDNGVDARHPDLRPQVREQLAFARGSSVRVRLGSDNRACDGDDHATHVAGIIGARGDDGYGVAGVSWQVSLLDYSVFEEYDEGCGANDGDVLAAIRAATLADAHVINLSLGGFSPEAACSTAYQTVIDEARAAGAVVVAASGNAEQDRAVAGRPNVPASCNGVISVGAITVAGTHATYSTTNEHVDLAAPGGDRSGDFASGILSTVGGGGHDWLDGTSMAAAYVSGVAALLHAAAPGLTADEVEGLLEATARDRGPAGRDPAYGWGVVDAAVAVERAEAGVRPTPEPDPRFPVSDEPTGPLQAPPSEEPQVYRVSAGTALTEAVPQAVAVSRAAFIQGTARHAVLSRGDGFADALAGSSLTLGVGPLLFAGPSDRLPAATREELLRVLPRGSPVYLLGGSLALPALLEEELRQLGFVPIRAAGQTREETAVAVAYELDNRRLELGLPDPGITMLATGDDWPDAVTAGSLGAHEGIPILLTPSAQLHPAPARLLRQLKPERLLVLGGPSAVSDATLATAASAAGSGTRTSRVAGPDRYATAVAVAELFQALLQESGLQPRCVLAVNVVRADGFAHALSASGLGGTYGCVVVAAEGAAGERLPAVTRGFVDRLSVDGVVAGGVDLVSDNAQAELHRLLQR